ncbi:hypothetical protein ACIQD3_04410 [Peribacillus loiseleuriae]|uniref:hypothetical protein n=1 Tax=Peribacillus loiseleuriae TaxID=1679170 RepID=UPI00382C5254
MKVKYKILYKNGVEDEIIQKESEKEITDISLVIYKAFENELGGVLTFGDGVSAGHYVQVADVSRVLINTIEN